MPKETNRTHVSGILIREPELRHAKNGSLAICQLSFAQTTYYKDQEQKLLLDIVCFGKTAEFVAERFKKGQRVDVTGRLQTDSWVDKNSGQNRYKTKMIANWIVPIDGVKQEVREAPAEPSYVGDDAPF